MPQTSSVPGIRFERDRAGRIVRRDVTLYDTPETRRYAYDAAGRLSRVTGGSGALCESYQYDHEGRRLADINPARFRGERRYSYAAGNRLSQTGQAQYRHDGAGFRTLKVEDGGPKPRETRYQYEPSGLLLAVELPGPTIEYAYDSGGMRREKRVDGRLVEAYRWLDPLRLSEFHDGAKWWRLAYDGPGRTPVGLTDGRASFFLYSDHLGTPLALADMDGNIVQAMRYDSFGNLLETRGQAVRLPIGFAGGLFDADTGLTRFVWRDYDADTGRFTALDPLGAKGVDCDLYGYCVDDPVNRVDAWGLDDGPFDFGGEGRTPADGPKYGNFCGKNWTGGWNPGQHGGKSGPFGSTDSLDEKCRVHDFCWSDCDSAADKESCKRQCNASFVEKLKSLPNNSSQWERQPPPGKEAQAENMKEAATWWFDN